MHKGRTDRDPSRERKGADRREGGLRMTTYRASFTVQGESCCLATHHEDDWSYQEVDAGKGRPEEIDGDRMLRFRPDINTRLWGAPMLRTALEGTLRRVKTPGNCSLSGTVLLVTLLLFGSLLVAPMAEARGRSSRSSSVGGTVSGLSGGDLILVNNETDALSVSSNGPFKFTLTSSGEGEYSVLLSSQPPGQVCTVANGSGVIANADITDVTVACAPGAEATLYTFSGGTDGSYPDSGLTAGPDGDFYGTTTYGGARNLGTVYKITPAGVHTVLYSFTDGPGDGQYPASGLELGTDEAFYATTTAGGAFGLGTFFRITRAGIATTLYSFGGNGSGARPQGLTLLADGSFYGTTTSGGANNLGTVYRMTPEGVQTVLYSFTTGPDGHTPAAGLSSASDGYLYGVTYYGGTNNFGTIFRIAPNGTGYVTLHSFAGGAADGKYPGTKLRNVSDGTLYGSTGAGGAGGLGTIFRYDPIAGAARVIHSFTGGPADGNYPSCRLRVGNDGNLYGVTFYGGYFDLGTFFRITPAGVLTVLHSFAGGTDGRSPNSSLLVTSDGAFYGTTVTGGPTNNGTIYKIRP